jgi:DNA-directed RNA polymerase subunit RPC12/RpoP
MAIVNEDYRPSHVELLQDMMVAAFGDKKLTFHCFNCGTRYTKQYMSRDWEVCPNCKSRIVP